MQQRTFSPSWFALIILGLCSIATAQTYRITDVGTLGGASASAEAINKFAATTGTSATQSACCFAFLQSQGHDINLEVPLFWSGGYAINALSQVTGYGLGANGYRAFVASTNGVTILPTFSGNAGGAYGINDQGDVVGWSYTSSLPSASSVAFLYHNGNLIDLGNLGGIGNTIAYGINNAGQVVGYSWNPTGNYQAFLWANGKMTGLVSPNGGASEALAINQNGQITGRYYNGFVDHAFLYTNGVMKDIDSNLKSLSVGLAINNKGVIVGYTQNAQGVNAFVWKGGGRLLNLNQKIPQGTGWKLLHATGINDLGQISGDGTLHGVSRGFILTP